MATNSPERRFRKNSGDHRNCKRCLSVSAILISISLLLSGCSSSLPGGASGASAAAGPLVANPSSVSFGAGAATPIGKAISSTVTITNRSARSLIIQSVKASSSVFSLQGWTGPVTLAPGRSTPLVLLFTPLSQGHYSGTLSIASQVKVPTTGPPIITSENGVLTTATVPLSGTTLATPGTPQISITPGSIQLKSGQSEQYVASVTGFTNPAVTWSATLGVISYGGLYTAPPVKSTTADTITATSVSSPSIHTTASVTIQAAAAPAPTPPAAGVVTVNVSPGTASLQAGQSQQFTAAVTGSTNTAVTWTAALGSITSAGLYTAPSIKTAATDTVSATSIASTGMSAAVKVSVTPAATTPPAPTTPGEPAVLSGWTARNQQPLSTVYYPNSVWTTPLPTTGSFAVQNHLLANSDAIILNLYGGSDNPTNNPPTAITTTPAGSTATTQRELYYSGESDPVYKLIACTVAQPTQPANQPVGKYFHLRSGAQYVSNTGDSSLQDWDQSLDLDSTPGGRILSIYAGSGDNGRKALSTSCTCNTAACADTTPACQITSHAEYCDVGHPFSDPLNGIGDGIAWSSMNNGSGSAFTRVNEVMAGTINDAMMTLTNCTAPGPSFPAKGDSLACHLIGLSETNAPHNGALFWIDSAYNCGALAAWQRPFCVALQTYGAYQRDTNGSGEAGEGLYLRDLESQIPIQDEREPDPTPFLNFMDQFSGADGAAAVYCMGSPVTRCNLRPFAGMRGLITGDAGNGYKPHLHVVDPCVPRHEAAQTTTCTGSPSD